MSINLSNFYLTDEIHMNVPKNVKLLAFPSGVTYNEKYIIEEVNLQHFVLALAQILFTIQSPQHLQHQQHIHQPATSFRANGTTSMQPSFFVGGTNYAYISKMGSKIETAEPARIIKQEANNNQGQVKQRIIYEIATEVSVATSEKVEGEYSLNSIFSRK